MGRILQLKFQRYNSMAMAKASAVLQGISGSTSRLVFLGSARQNILVEICINSLELGRINPGDSPQDVAGSPGDSPTMRPALLACIQSAKPIPALKVSADVSR